MRPTPLKVSIKPGEAQLSAGAQIFFT